TALDSTYSTYGRLLPVISWPRSPGPESPRQWKGERLPANQGDCHDPKTARTNQPMFLLASARPIHPPGCPFSCAAPPPRGEPFGSPPAIHRQRAPHKNLGGQGDSIDCVNCVTEKKPPLLMSTRLYPNQGHRRRNGNFGERSRGFFSLAPGRACWQGEKV